MKVPETVYFALFLLLVTLFFVVGAFSYDPVARVFPLIIGIPVAIFSSLQILTHLFPKTFSGLQRLDTKQVIQVDQVLMAQAKAVRAEGPKKGRELDYFAWTGVFVLAIYMVGFLLAIPLFLIGLLCLQLKERFWLSLVITAVMLGIAYFGFTVLMEVPLFKGIIFS
ncbi:MAG: tripartite tricarboxylate transporter TctB family protein [Deltaproteobacteria bacterium]|jgi:hypothetical protein|nr:tripartite tricarboxylate transporter TctB family protein [Deltaproteobacteria bacterium]